MECSDWVLYEPKTKADIIAKIENDGYTYPHYVKAKNWIGWKMCVRSIKDDCERIGIALGEVYPLQTRLF